MKEGKKTEPGERAAGLNPITPLVEDLPIPADYVFCVLKNNKCIFLQRAVVKDRNNEIKEYYDNQRHRCR
jgi:hypothetical protein